VESTAAGIGPYQSAEALAKTFAHYSIILDKAGDNAELKRPAVLVLVERITQQPDDKFIITLAEGLHKHGWWLPRKDSNLDKEYQKLLCYHYTTG
jgi:hypothetical protein